MEKRSDPRIVQELTAGSYVFAWEEYWEEDDAGFCCPDFVWEMHTRLKVFEAESRRLVKTMDYDSGQREKDLVSEDGVVIVIFCPNYALRRKVSLDPSTLAVVREESEEIAVSLL